MCEHTSNSDIFKFFLNHTLSFCLSLQIYYYKIQYCIHTHVELKGIETITINSCCNLILGISSLYFLAWFLLLMSWENEGAISESDALSVAFCHCGKVVYLSVSHCHCPVWIMACGFTGFLYCISNLCFSIIKGNNY